MFAYIPLCKIALTNVGVATYGPLYAPCGFAVHGTHRGMAIAPALPTAPKCRCDAVALPLSPENFNCQTRLLFLPATISLAVKSPFAPVASLGAGTSLLTLRVALSR